MERGVFQAEKKMEPKILRGRIVDFGAFLPGQWEGNLGIEQPSGEVSREPVRSINGQMITFAIVFLIPSTKRDPY